METAVRRIVSVKVVRTQMGQEWRSVLLHLEKETAVNYNVWTFHPWSKRFAIDHQEKVQTGMRTVLETFALGQVLKVATNAPEVLPLFNAVAKEAESTLKDTSLQDPLCARCVHSLAAKIQSIQAVETIAAISLYWCLQQSSDSGVPTLHYITIL